jgi:3-(3-hydroxy-phenyl)propionate hydroxylase
LRVQDVDHAKPDQSVRDFQSLEFAYSKCKDQNGGPPARHPVVVVGAGPVGLSLAIDLAQKGQRVVVLDNDFRLSTGSRAICFAKRTLEVFDRLGVGEQVATKGVSWNVGKVFFREQLTFQFDLVPEEGNKHPAFFNIQQFYVEGFLVDQALREPLIEIRWMNKVIGVQPGHTGPAIVDVETPDGVYRCEAEYLIACDGSRSSVRQLLGKESKGRVFQDRFLIADVTMSADFPTERWFWFDPPFHPNQSVLLHKQPDGQWRIDFQLGWDADPEEERKPENIRPRVQALLGKDIEFEIAWASVYTFACLRMDTFCEGRVFFAGDSAHGVSPFGARGANSGVQDAENLAWKLDLVLRGLCAPQLLESYCQEREAAADENILHSTRATDFISPKSAMSRLFRDTTLELAQDFPFARRLVNSGRLSSASRYLDSKLNWTLQEDQFDTGLVPGCPALNGPLLNRTGNGVTGTWLLDQCRHEFVVLLFRGSTRPVQDRRDIAESITLEINVLRAKSWPIKLMEIFLAENLISEPGSADPRGFEPHILGRHSLKPARDSFIDQQNYLRMRFEADEGTVYLLRPDQHVLARWKHYQDQGLTDVLDAIGATHDQ